jgi:hypothetical protein
MSLQLSVTIILDLVFTIIIFGTGTIKGEADSSSKQATICTEMSVFTYILYQVCLCINLCVFCLSVTKLAATYLVYDILCIVWISLKKLCSKTFANHHMTNRKKNDPLYTHVG